MVLDLQKFYAQLYKQGLKKGLGNMYHSLDFYIENYHSSQEMIIVIESQFQKIYDCNNTLLKVLEYSKHDILKMNSYLDLFHPSCHQKIELIQERFIETESQHLDELILITRAQHYMPVIGTFSSIQNPQTGFNLLKISLQDISQTKKAQRTIEQANADLRDRNDQLNTLLHCISHDLKAPLRGIYLTSQFLIEDEYHNVSHDSQKYLDGLIRRVRRMEDLLDSLTQYFFAPKDQNNHEKVSISVFDLREIFDFPIGVQIKVVGHPQTFYTKRTPFMIILTNLVGNAIKHHHQHENCILTITVEEKEEFYAFSIQDNGPGIPLKYHEYVFGFFNKLKSRDVVEGSGMGLTIVKKVVLSEGGSIYLNSEEGKGATFTFMWPKRLVSLSPP